MAHQVKRFLSRLALFHVSVWKGAREKGLKRGGPLKTEELGGVTSHTYNV